jgi:predicted RNase H-like HicB family nuclease
MAKKRQFQGHFLQREKWWIAWTDDVPGALTQGATLEEAKENLRDAILLMLEPMDTGNLPEETGQLVHETIVL